MFARLFKDCFKKPRQRSINGISNDPLLSYEKEEINIEIKDDKKPALEALTPQLEDPFTQVQKDYPRKIQRVGDTEDRKLDEKQSWRSAILIGLLSTGATAATAYGAYKLSSQRQAKADYAIDQYSHNPNLLNASYPNTTCAEVFTPYNVTSGYDFCSQYDSLNQNFSQTFNISYDVLDKCYQTLNECSEGGAGLIFVIICVALIPGVAAFYSVTSAGCNLYSLYEINRYNNQIHIKISLEEETLRERVFLFRDVEVRPSRKKKKKETEAEVREISKAAHEIGLFAKNERILQVIDEYLEYLGTPNNLTAKRFIRLSMPVSRLKDPTVTTLKIRYR